MAEIILIILGVVVALIVGFAIGVMALLYGIFDGLTNIDGPPRVGLIEDWKNRRAYKKEIKNRSK